MKVPLVSEVFQKIREAFFRYRFLRELPAIRGTPPILPGDQPFTLLSMVHHRDVECYLLAVKSLTRFLAPRRIVVVTDPSITEDDRRSITEHIRDVTLLSAEDHRDPDLPQGGCWERLIAIADNVGDGYVVQLDADTVTLADVPEVRAAIQSRQSFVLGTEDNQDFVSCLVAAAWAKQQLIGSGHVQLLAESRLDSLPNAECRRYVRGCAGFSGFAPCSFTRQDLRELSSHMGAALGSCWSAWGTEQFASNFIVANATAAVVLPHPKYCHPGGERTGAVFLHFIGYLRFVNGRYAAVTREVCAALGHR